MGELKACPFCGNGNALDQYPCDFLDGTGANVVRCAWCHGAAPMRTWNTRAASGGDSASLEKRGRAGVSLASLASIEALIVDAYRDGMQMRSFDMVAARNAITAALANQQECDINPSGPSFQAGYNTGHSEFQWLSGLVKNPVCDRCGATSDAEAETKCRPTDCSCPGTEFPLSQLWALQRTEANQQGVGGWQPIETAPRDGEYVLVANSHGAWIAKWNPIYESGYRPSNPWKSMMLNHDHIEKPGRYDHPTHWQHLPEPPTQPAGDVGSEG